MDYLRVKMEATAFVESKISEGISEPEIIYLLRKRFGLGKRFLNDYLKEFEELKKSKNVT